MNHPIHAIFAFGQRTYFKAMAAKMTRFKRGTMTKNLACKSHYGLQSVFGWEGDCHAPIAFVDGCYLLRDRGQMLIHFGYMHNHITGKIDWYNKEGFLPCLVSHFISGETEVTIENFADQVTVNGNDYVVAYSRLTVTNHGAEPAKMKKPSRFLTALTSMPDDVPAGETVTVDFAVFADRFGGKYAFPAPETLHSLGDWQSHYDHMKDYWTQRLSETAQLDLPDPELVNAYKAGYIYTMIVKDGDRLHVGENGYDNVFDHDILGITVSLLTMGDFRHFKEYVPHILDHVLYPDARWKYSWPFAVYLMKTGDKEYLQEVLPEIRKNTHTIEADRGEYGIMKRTNAIDSLGYWTVDNWSALTGLASYKYICDTLGEEAEALWAQTQYNSLLAACDKQMNRIMQDKNIPYIPIAMDRANEESQRNDPRDANALSMFLFGRWAWDGFLLGAPQYGVMIDRIDDTYEYIANLRKGVADSDCNFGGYPHGWYCSAYNAGYGSTALRGERHRSLGIEGYRHMIARAMSGPFSWWEGVGEPRKTSIWNRPHSATGGGSCPHIWGQSTATKVLLDSLIAEKADGTLLIFRGIPADWYTKKIQIRNYPVSGGRVNVTLDGKIFHIEGAISGKILEISHPNGVERVHLPQDVAVWKMGK